MMYCIRRSQIPVNNTIGLLMKYQVSGHAFIAVCIGFGRIVTFFSHSDHAAHHADNLDSPMDHPPEPSDATCCMRRILALLRQRRQCLRRFAHQYCATCVAHNECLGIMPELLVGTGPLDILSQIVIFLSLNLFLFVNIMFLNVGVANYFRRYKMLQEFCQILRLPNDRSVSYGIYVDGFNLDLWFSCRLLLKDSFGKLYHTRVQFNLFLLTLLPVVLCLYVTFGLSVPSLYRYINCDLLRFRCSVAQSALLIVMFRCFVADAVIFRYSSPIVLALSIGIGILFLLVICSAIFFGSLKNSHSDKYLRILRALLHRLKMAKHIHARFADRQTLLDVLAQLDLARNGYGTNDFDSTVDAVSSICELLGVEGEGNNERLFGMSCSTEILSTLASAIFAFSTFIASFLTTTSSADSACAPIGNLAQQLCSLNQGEGALAKICFNSKNSTF